MPQMGVRIFFLKKYSLLQYIHKTSYYEQGILQLIYTMMPETA